MTSELEQQNIALVRAVILLENDVEQLSRKNDGLKEKIEDIEFSYRELERKLDRGFGAVWREFKSLEEKR